MSTALLAKPHRPDPTAFARRMIAQYEAELSGPAPRTDAAIAHRGIVEILLEDWRKRLAVLTGANRSI